jgi:hypothetical protein
MRYPNVVFGSLLETKNILFNFLLKKVVAFCFFGERKRRRFNLLSLFSKKNLGVFFIALLQEKVETPHPFGSGVSTVRARGQGAF